MEKKSVQYFVAVVEACDEHFEEFRIFFLKKSGKSTICVPEQTKKLYDIEASDICEVLPQPVSFHHNQYCFEYDFSSYNM